MTIEIQIVENALALVFNHAEKSMRVCSEPLDLENEANLKSQVKNMGHTLMDIFEASILPEILEEKLAFFESQPDAEKRLKELSLAKEFLPIRLLDGLKAA